MSDIAQKLWGFCHTLRHDGIGYLDYIEQITYLLFLKMADEKGLLLPSYQEADAGGAEQTISCDWPTLAGKSGIDLSDHYVRVLLTLGKASGLLGDIFAGAQSRFRNPVNIKQLVSLIDKIEWTALKVDVKAEAYEGLLERAASEGKKGAGQLFTPRPLIHSIVRCVRPDPRAHRDFAIGDPACGTGGFLVAAYEWLLHETGGGAFDRDTAKRVRISTYFGKEISPLPRRLAVMNLYLHQVEPQIAYGDSIYEAPGDQRYDVILTNPPFGTRGANQAPDRDDFTIETSNKQLNFLQHILTLLKPGGRAGVVVPDNCFFADKAGEVFEILMQECDLHTVIRLPRGTFTPYSPGTKTYAIFFRKGLPTENVWLYDNRANIPSITKKERPLTDAHFAAFEQCFGPDPNGRAPRNSSDSPDDRWRRFSIEEVKERGYKLDAFKWLKDESLDDPDDLLEPEELATDAISELESAVEELNAILLLLENGGGLASLLEVGTVA